MRIDLPRWPLADRLSAALAVAAAAALEAVASLQPAVPHGAGVVAALALLGALRARLRHSPSSAGVDAHGRGWLEGGTGAPVPARLGPGTRVLGRSVVLHWQRPAGPPYVVWLTPADLPRPVLRALAATLKSQPRPAQPPGVRSAACR